METVDSLNDNDVLFGKGLGACGYIGTERFRDLCDQWRQSYKTSMNAEKTTIAKKIVDTIRNKGGRFLKRDESDGAVDDVVFNGVWYKVQSETEILEKTKQCLRRQSKKRHHGDKVDDAFTAETNPLLSEVAASSLQVPGLSSAPSLLPVPPTLLMCFLPASPAGVMLAHHASLLLLATDPGDAQVMMRLQQHASEKLTPSTLPAFQQGTGAALMWPPQQQQEVHKTPVSRPTATKKLQDERASMLVQLSPQPNTWAATEAIASMCTENEEDEEETANGIQELLDSADAIEDLDSAVAIESSTKNEQDVDGIQDLIRSADVITSNDNDEVAGEIEDLVDCHFLLSGLPRFTDHEGERARMTSEEKDAILCDMFGKECNVDALKSAKRRHVLDQDSVTDLIKQMREELERIPKEGKRALLEAQEKCHSEEFSDYRLEQFLRCEGMNFQLAAQRFVRYWKCRRELFGPDKFTLPMTLSEALRDDQIALQLGFANILPHEDASGRRLLFLHGACHDNKGYTTMSLLRAYWYLMEVTCRTNKDADCRIVQLYSNKGTTIWSYDHVLYDHYVEFESSCWPWRIDCIHAFMTPTFIRTFVAPVLSHLQNKECRTRSIWHATEEHEIPSALSEYGITREMTPTELGGLIRLDASEWVAHRRAVEMEEI